MTTDRELLELAAKAAGISGEFSRWHQAYGDCWVEGVDTGGPILWNPLTDDGDALRLAVNLKIVVVLYVDHVVGWLDGGHIGTGLIQYEGNPLAATRRAIVLAAAEIGKGMK